jgi:GNS1/SUR4 family
MSGTTPAEIAVDTARRVLSLTDVDLPFIALYAVTVPLLLRSPLFSSGRSADGKGRSSWLNGLMVLYNLVMSVFSAWSAFHVLYALTILPVKTNDCELWFNSEPQTKFETVSHYFYLSKYVEFADTLFLILNGRSVNWLHYLHHLGAPIDMGGLLRSHSESLWIFIGLNGTIHTLMYAYFGFSALGGRWQKLVSPLRVVMTSMQIVQFLTGFTIVFAYRNIPCFAADGDRMAFYYFTYAYVLLVLGFFLVFFVKSYMPKKKSDKAKAT